MYYMLCVILCTGVVDFTLEIEGQVESIVLWDTVSHAVSLHIWSNIEGYLGIWAFCQSLGFYSCISCHCTQ